MEYTQGKKPGRAEVKRRSQTESRIQQIDYHAAAKADTTQISRVGHESLHFRP